MCKGLVKKGCRLEVTIELVLKMRGFKIQKRRQKVKEAIRTKTWDSEITCLGVVPFGKLVVITALPCQGEHAFSL